MHQEWSDALVNETQQCGSLSLSLGIIRLEWVFLLLLESEFSVVLKMKMNSLIPSSKQSLLRSLECLEVNYALQVLCSFVIFTLFYCE